MKLLSALTTVSALLTSVIGDVAVEARDGPIFAPLRPPSYPLAVKSPYLSAWLPAGSSRERSGLLPGVYPKFWTDRTLGWTGLVRVDGKTYNWMGHLADDFNVPLAVQTYAHYTATKTEFQFIIDEKVEVAVHFVSPVYPEDFRRQSLVFSYLHVSARSLDGEEHDVQIYTDITGEWVDSDDKATIQWSTGTQGDVHYHKINKEVQETFNEHNDMAIWGDWFYAATASKNMTYASGISDEGARYAFIHYGFLGNHENTNFRPIKDLWPVFAYAIDFGSVGPDRTKAKSTVFTVGLAQETAARMTKPSGRVEIPSLWTTYFDSGVEALEFFHNDYAYASKTMTALDDKIWRDSVAVAGKQGINYASITHLAFRQAFGGTQLAGTPDRAYMFMKEISSSGNIQTVDVFFPMHPLLLYTNPKLLKLVMAPLLEYQESGLYPNNHSIHDLGPDYPKARGHPAGDDESMPLENTGNMLIAALAYAQRANDTKFLNEHMLKFQQWTNYLAEHALYPQNQLSTDDFAGPLVNQTNLALKGILGMHAMAEIFRLTNRTDLAEWYSPMVSNLTKKWEKMTMNKETFLPHAVLSYNDPHSYGLLYNLYADRLLGLNKISQEVYDTQSDWYPAVRKPFGVPLDSRSERGKIDWQMWAAAVASEKTQGLMIQDLVDFVRKTPVDRPLPDLFNVYNGGFPGNVFTNRPVVGGVFALLALPQLRFD